MSVIFFSWPWSCVLTDVLFYRTCPSTWLSFEQHSIGQSVISFSTSTHPLCICAFHWFFVYDSFFALVFNRCLIFYFQILFRFCPSWRTSPFDPWNGGLVSSFLFNELYNFYNKFMKRLLNYIEFDQLYKFKNTFFYVFYNKNWEMK